jgi:hypothetical protein
MSESDIKINPVVVASSQEPILIAPGTHDDIRPVTPPPLEFEPVGHKRKAESISPLRPDQTVYNCYLLIL